MLELSSLKSETKTMDEVFAEEVEAVQGLVVVDYWGPKCVNCLALMPAVEQLETEYGSQFKFCKLNTEDKNRRFCISRKIMGLPVIQFYRNGEEVARFTGPEEATEENLRAKFAELAASV